MYILLHTYGNMYLVALKNTDATTKQWMTLKNSSAHSFISTLLQLILTHDQKTS